MELQGEVLLVLIGLINTVLVGILFLFVKDRLATIAEMIRSMHRLDKRLVRIETKLGLKPLPDDDDDD